MSVKDYNRKRTAYINTVYKNLTIVKCKTPGYVINAEIFNFVINYRKKYGINKEMDLLVKICDFENGLFEPTYFELKKMVAGALKAEQCYKQHKLDLKLKEIKKDFRC